MADAWGGSFGNSFGNSFNSAAPPPPPPPGPSAMTTANPPLIKLSNRNASFAVSEDGSGNISITEFNKLTSVTKTVVDNANLPNILALAGALTPTAFDVAGNMTAWTEGGVSYTATYVNNVLATTTGAGVTKTYTYPNGNLTVVIS